MNWSPPSSSVHGISQATTLEWVTIPFSRGNFWPMDQTQISRIVGRFFTVWATREALPYYWVCLKPHSKAAIRKGNEPECIGIPLSVILQGKHSVFQPLNVFCGIVIFASCCGLAWSSMGNFPHNPCLYLAWISFYRNKGYKNKLSGCSTYPTATATYASGYIYLLGYDINIIIQFSSVQSLSRVQLFVTPWTAAHQASLAITNSRSLPKLMSVKSVMPSNHLIFCCPLLLLPSIFPSIRVFSYESSLHIRWRKY